MIAILGASTPFTAAFVEALRALEPCEVRLYGRDAPALARMEKYARRRLPGFRVWATIDLDEAIDRARVVVNQIRFGGLEGRARDEELAARYGFPADETLGPCGLSAALRIAPHVRHLAARLTGATVLNLANPLSVTTALIGHGIGVCELPQATAREACRLLGVPFEEVEWDYAGLNHRGFVFSLRRRGEELLTALPALLGDRTVFGVTADDLREVGALPMKHYRLKAQPTRRSEYLMELKDQLARELESADAPPPSLSKRDMCWYEQAIVPAIAALLGSEPQRLVVNRLGDDGLVHEAPALVSKHGIERAGREPPSHVAARIAQTALHEHAVLDAVAQPSLERIERALELDPLTPKAHLRAIAREIGGNQG